MSQLLAVELGGVAEPGFPGAAVEPESAVPLAGALLVLAVGAAAPPLAAALGGLVADEVLAGGRVLLLEAAGVAALPACGMSP